MLHRPVEAAPFYGNFATRHVVGDYGRLGISPVVLTPFFPIEVFWIHLGQIDRESARIISSAKQKRSQLK